MRRLLPEPACDIDPYEAYAQAEREWLRVGMVLSVDGSVTDEEGWTDRLGGDADFRVFRTLRALADGIMVGAATVRTGRIGPARLRADLRERRGRPPAPVIVVSRSLDLDWSLPLFTKAETPTIVVTSRAALRGSKPPGAVVAAGEDEIDLAQAVRELRTSYGLGHLLCEGGPRLTTSLLGAGLVDELCLNLAPTLIGGPHHTRLLGELPGRTELALAGVCTDEGLLFLRYRAIPAGPGRR
jgi:riboflavin biosynthesis pyrimidine reductase